MDTASYQLAAKLLLQWYSTHYRPLPWRQQATPYRVWVSEIMLQQTRIEAVLPYYERFMSRLPDVRALAIVPDDVLMKLWEGLGYYSRVRNLKKAAQQICEQYEGILPADYDKLRALPGIGEYTAGAIASIAYNIPVPAVDGNVMRVLSRFTGDDTDVLSTKAKHHYGELAAKMLLPEQPGRFNQALMELGETVCVPNTAPDCEQCPWQQLCVANAAGLTTGLPIRTKRKNRRIEERKVALVIFPGEPRRVLLHRRPEKGLLAGLWELPNAPVSESVLPPEWVRRCKPVECELPAGKHIFTHVEWHLSGCLFCADTSSNLPPDYAAVTLEELQKQYALPSAFRLYAKILPHILDKEGL